MVMGRNYHSADSVLVHLAILVLMTPAVVGQTVAGSPANPFSDPQNDPHNPLKYIPSNTLTAIAFGKTKTLKAWPSTD